ncbi:MAG TPA: nuclear transport factor 2 family protein [Terriglobales bacterium]
MSYRPYEGPATSGPSRDVATTIRETTQDFCTAFNTGNYDHCSGFFAPDGCFMPPNHEGAQGSRAIEKTLQHFADIGYQDLRLETQRVEHSGELAMEVGRYTVSIRLDNGSTVVDRGKYLSSWRRFGAWLILANCWSSDMPALAQSPGLDKQLPEGTNETTVPPHVSRSA